MVLFLLSDIFGIGKKEQGYKVYEAYSSIKEGEELIQKYKIQCIAKDVESIIFIEISRGDTFFAYNITHNNYYFYEDIKYVKVPDDIVKKYKILARFSWFDNYGKWILLGLYGVLVIYWYLDKNYLI